MELIEAKILLGNLVKRIKTQEDGIHQLPGVLTDGEIEALHLAIQLLGVPQPAPDPGGVKNPVSGETAPQPPVPIPPIPAFNVEEPGETIPDQKTPEPMPKSFKPRVELDLSVLSLDPPPKNARLCLDFGTAMSKATLVQENEGTDSEEIHVLRLGVPGDQEEISEVMLISSVYIDGEGMLWFGKAAVDRSMIEGGDGSRQRLDNIKRRLSEEGWDEQVSDRLNPTDLRITYGDMVLAYLMFLTWAVNSCLEQLGYSWNLPRRFAMPCFTGAKERETVHRLKQAVGEAQILADSFYSTLKEGIPLDVFLAAAQELREKSLEYPYVAENITEPLGVAGSLLSWRAPFNQLVMVIDVGAGTSDFSLYRINVNPENQENTAVEIDGSSRVLTEAGNHLDRMLIELIIKKSGITSDDPMWVNVRSALELQIRDLKESLFNGEFVSVSLMNDTEVDIELSEFLDLAPVARFGENLRETMINILATVDSSWVKWVAAHPTHHLVVALTGGGSELKMVQALAEGTIRVSGQSVTVARALPFPKWIQEIDANLAADYPRVAVSLGGARRRLIERGGSARITAGDVTQPAKLGGYYMKGN